MKVFPTKNSLSSGPKVIKAFFSFSYLLNMKFILLINVKMSTIGKITSHAKFDIDTFKLKHDQLRQHEQQTAKPECRGSAQTRPDQTEDGAGVQLLAFYQQDK